MPQQSNTALLMLTAAFAVAAQATTTTTASYACNPAHSYPAGQTCVTNAAGSLALSTVSTTASYACNPAHSYPAGQTCVTNAAGSLTLSTVSTTATPYPAGSTLPDGGYICNPAHSYPGATCVGTGTAYPTLSYYSSTSDFKSWAAATTTPQAGKTTAPASVPGSSKTSQHVATYTGAANSLAVSPAIPLLALFALF